MSELVSSLVTLDAGRRWGWSFFRIGLLFAAGYAKSSDHAHAIMPKEALRAKRVIIELPQQRPGKTHVASIITLSVHVGQLKGDWESRGAKVDLVWPTTWKGSVPKDIHNKRVLAALSEDELKLLPKRPRAKDYDHNCIDAVGIGLWKLGRM